MRLFLSRSAFEAFRVLFWKYFVLGSPFAALVSIGGLLVLDPVLIFGSPVFLVMTACSIAATIWLIGMTFDFTSTVIRYIFTEIAILIRRILYS